MPSGFKLYTLAQERGQCNSVNKYLVYMYHHFRLLLGCVIPVKGLNRILMQ